MSYGVGHRHGSDPVLLWQRLAATAPIRPLACKPLCAAGVPPPQKKMEVQKILISPVLLTSFISVMCFF